MHWRSENTAATAAASVNSIRDWVYMTFVSGRSRAACAGIEIVAVGSSPSTTKVASNSSSPAPAPDRSTYAAAEV